jgi:hypothetical protein
MQAQGLNCKVLDDDTTNHKVLVQQPRDCLLKAKIIILGIEKLGYQQNRQREEGTQKMDSSREHRQCEVLDFSDVPDSIDKPPDARSPLGGYQARNVKYSVSRFPLTNVKYSSCVF